MKDNWQIRQKMKNNGTTNITVMISPLLRQFREESIQTFIDFKVKQTNKNCPVDIANGMTMDECLAEGDKTMKYCYTVPDNIVNGSKPDDEFRATAISSVRSALKFEKIKNYGITYVYVFYDKFKNLLGEIKIDPENYKIIYE